MALDSITDYTKTQRIVLLIDLNPLLHLQNPSYYLTSLLSSAKSLLSFSPFSSSTLFAFKPFFSSLSPLLSSSKIQSLIPNFPISLSFNHPTSTFHSLSLFLDSFLNSDKCPLSDLPNSNASCVAASMRQLIHDYAWDPVIGDEIKGMVFDNLDFVRSNSVFLFSMGFKSVKSLSEFLNVDVEDDCLGSLSLFTKKFHGLFESLSNVFISKDIHFTWVDVSYDLECVENKISMDEAENNFFQFFESVIRSLGWGFCSTDSIVLGSALVPFGLIYPKIGVSSKFYDRKEISKNIQAQLSLEIVDINGKPLESKCCALELLELKDLYRKGHDDVLPTLGFSNSQTGNSEKKRSSWEWFCNGVTKLHVKAVESCKEGVKYKGHLSGPVLVCECSSESGKNKKRSSDSNYFVDKVLELLAIEFGDSTQGKSIAIWQILLSFLYKESYYALVYISNGNGDSHTGILRPFTVSSALLFIVDNKFSPPNMHLRSFIDSEALPSINCSEKMDGKRKNDTESLDLIQDLTWTAFCEAAFEHTKLDLGEVYFSRKGIISKKLRFLKCWVKQIKRSSPSVNLWKSQSLDLPKEKDDNLPQINQESDEANSFSISASAGEDNSLAEASRILDEAALNFLTETSEVFFSNLANKIQQALESEEVALGAFAERIVNSAIYWLSEKHEPETTLETNGCLISQELTKLLSKEPKDLAAKHKNNDSSFQASDTEFTGLASGNLVREYELQILFRMEILRSEIGVDIDESVKQKFVKQICMLLETIQCHLEGGFFGDWSLQNYVAKIIKGRYSQTLEDVAHRIYEKMDLLLFDDEEESPNCLLNSEDSNNSWRQKGDETGEKHISNDPHTSDENPVQQNGKESPLGIKKERACKMIEAQERRERARRFSHFTKSISDLQRVWAPKQPKPMKLKSDSSGKLSKRKNYERASLDMVCETPMTDKRRSCSRGSDTHNQDGHGSVSKALFKDKD